MEYSQIRLMLNGVFTRGHHSLFNNDLFKELNEHVMTLKVYQHRIGSPAFADDVVVTVNQNVQ